MPKNTDNDSVFTAVSNFTAGSSTTGGTGTTIGHIPVKTKRCWFDPFWSCMLNDHSDKETDKAKKTAATKEAKESKKFPPSDYFSETDQFSIESGEEDPWEFLESKGSRGSVFRSERERQKYVDFIEWKKEKKLKKLRTRRTVPRNKDEDHSLSHDRIDTDSLHSKRTRSRRNNVHGRSSSHASRRDDDEESMESFDSDDEELDNRGKRSKRQERFGSRYRHKDGRSHRPEHRRGSSAKARKKPEASAKKEKSKPSKKSHPNVDDGERTCREKTETRDLPPRIPKKSTKSKKKRSPPKIAGVEATQKSKGLEAKELLPVLKQHKVGSIREKDEQVLPSGPIISRKHFDIPQMQRAHSFDGVRATSAAPPNALFSEEPKMPVVGTKEKANMSAVGTTKKTESTPQVASAHEPQKPLTDISTQEAQKPLILMTPQNCVSEAGRTGSACGRDDSSSVRSSHSNKSGNVVKEYSTQAPLEEKVKTSPIEEMPQESPSNNPSKQSWRPDITTGRAAFHPISVSSSTSSRHVQVKKQTINAPQPAYNQITRASSAMSQDSTGSSDIISRSRAPPLYTRTRDDSTFVVGETREKRRSWKPELFKRTQSGDSASTSGLERKKPNSANRWSRSRQASSVC